MMETGFLIPLANCLSIHLQFSYNFCEGHFIFFQYLHYFHQFQFTVKIILPGHVFRQCIGRPVKHVTISIGRDRMNERSISTYFFYYVKPASVVSSFFTLNFSGDHIRQWNDIISNFKNFRYWYSLFFCLCYGPLFFLEKVNFFRLIA